MKEKREAFYDVFSYVDNFYFNKKSIKTLRKVNKTREK